MTYLISKGYFFHFLPSLAWLLFMVLPFLVSFTYFTETRFQATGILIFFLAFLTGDLISLKKSQFSKPLSPITFNFSNRSINFLYFGVFIIPLIHYLIIGNIPIIHLLIGNESLVDIIDDRFEFNRSKIPYWFSIVSNYSLFLLSPLAILILAIKRQFIRLGLITSWLVFYAISSGAKLPILFLFFTFLLISSFTLWSDKKKTVSTLIIISFLFICLSGITLKSKAISEGFKCPIPAGVELSPANILRSCKSGAEITINPISDTFGYRIFLTPVEVSNHWYHYHATLGNPNNSFWDLLNRKQEFKPANIIALNYYSRFWPQNYPPSTNANASIDAEAFSYGGIPLILLFAVVLILMRIAVNPSNNKIFIQRIIEGFGISYLAFLPFNASLPAILIPNGFIVILLASGVIKVISRAR